MESSQKMNTCSASRSTAAEGDAALGKPVAAGDGDEPMGLPIAVADSAGGISPAPTHAVDVLGLTPETTEKMKVEADHVHD